MLGAGPLAGASMMPSAPVSAAPGTAPDTETGAAPRIHDKIWPLLAERLPDELG